MMQGILKKLFKNEEQEADFNTPKDAVAQFELCLHDKVIGHLNYKNGKWTFTYSDEFKNQNDIDVLVDFPKKDKKYESDSLWPFFLHRIPGLGQPQVQRTIKREKLNAKSEIDLLKYFGRKTITNPFELSAL